MPKKKKIEFMFFKFCIQFDVKSNIDKKAELKNIYSPYLIFNDLLTSNKRIKMQFG